MHDGHLGDDDIILACGFPSPGFGKSGHTAILHFEMSQICNLRSNCSAAQLRTSHLAQS
jgi:hypothetical protein